VAGTFSRVLGHYVRDRKVLELKEALAKLSLFQAQWMEQASPAFKKKGRIQQGADADIVIFDPRTVAANAVYGKPYLKPTGIIHVLVAGTQVVQHAQPVKGQWPGAKILGPQKRNF
jgi:N-acyl-D-aspartate/D-glutamate deacylase